MNFTVIGGGGGTGGGPGGTAGFASICGCFVTGGGGGGGGAFGLKRNRLRSAELGFGCSASSASRCTSGASGLPGDCLPDCFRALASARRAPAGLPCRRIPG